MPPPGSLASLFIVGADILASARDAVTGLITLQLGDAVRRSVSSQNAELWFPFGWASRPAKATPGKPSAQAFGVCTGGRDAIIGGRDARSNAIYGGLAEGESCAYAPAGQARALFKADGSVTLFTTDDNTATGKSCSFEFRSTGLKAVFPWGSLVFTEADGLVVNHPASGTSMAMGPVDGMPAPLDVIKGAFSVSAPMVEAKGLVKLGKGPFLNAVAMPTPTPLVGTTGAGTGSGGVLIGTG